MIQKGYFDPGPTRWYNFRGKFIKDFNRRAMKKRIFVIVAVGLALALALGYCCSPNRAVQPEELPEEARLFLAAHYSDNPVSYIIKVGGCRGIYSVMLRDGTDVDFSHRGEVVSIEAARGNALPPCVWGLLPDAAVVHLRTVDAQPRIHAVEVGRDFYKVELVGCEDRRIFDRDGVLTGMEKRCRKH